MATRKSTSSVRPAEPIAVVGMACRFPGAPDIQSFWRLLMDGGNSISEWVPGSDHERFSQLFPDEAVRSEGCRFGAFVDGIDQFDDSFFRISPVEAVAKAYEAGLPVAFAGLFAGEERRRISVPGCPFQRRSYWIQP